jgi:uncharacterized protein
MKKARVFFAPAAESESPDALSRKARAVLLRTGFVDALAPEDFAALKIHFGEKGNIGHIKPAWLRGLVDEIKSRTPRAFLTDSNTLYTGPRSNSVEHIGLAWAHGFTPDVLGIPIIIADGLTGGDFGEARGDHGRVAAAKIAGAFLVSDALLGLSHVTGHVQTGIGASIKNLGMGCASRAGKLDQHAVVHPRVEAKTCRDCGLCREHCPAGAIVQEPGHVVIDGGRCTGCGECLVACKFGAIRIRWDEDSRRIQEKIAEYALLVGRPFSKKKAFLNFLIRVTKDCDCMAKAQPPIVEDIGILGSTDPVAVDRAAADLILARAGADVFRKGYGIDWSHQFAHAEKIGLGSTDYELVNVK